MGLTDHRWNPGDGRLPLPRGAGQRHRDGLLGESHGVSLRERSLGALDPEGRWKLWLVGGLVAIWIIFPMYWVANHPNWRTHIFQRGGPTTNQWFLLLLFLGIRHPNWRTKMCFGGGNEKQGARQWQSSRKSTCLPGVAEDVCLFGWWFGCQIFFAYIGT